MALLVDVLAWSTDVFGPLGAIGIFIVAFAESSFFPIPPDVLLIPLSLAAPELALLYALVATVGSVLGAFLGYYIGQKGGRPVLVKIAKEERVQKVENYFKKYGTWAIGIAGFTPIPYKIFTIAAGVFNHDLKKVILVSIVSRAARFFMIGIIIMFWGDAIITFIDQYFAAFTIGVTGLFILGYLGYKKFIKK